MYGAVHYEVIVVDHGLVNTEGDYHKLRNTSDVQYQAGLGSSMVARSLLKMPPWPVGSPVLTMMTLFCQVFFSILELLVDCPWVKVTK